MTLPPAADDPLSIEIRQDLIRMGYLSPIELQAPSSQQKPSLTGKNEEILGVHR